MSERSLVLLSGGVDSAVALWLRLRELPSDQIFTLSINFYRRSGGEATAARRLAQIAGVARHIEIDLPFLREAEDIAGLNETLPAAGRLPPVFLPVRNMIYYSVAAHIAVTLGAEEVVVGHNSDDAESFPDVGYDFIQLFNQLLARSLPGLGARVSAPLIVLRKPEVWKLGLRLGVPLYETWSCWMAGERHCGKCPGCGQRKRMFKELGLEDPTPYEDV
jgi:7-cyano-7-deazaguanine synthase